jgi:nicotinate-nucleotide pyrophosphorylase (carboxylating)
MEFLAEQIDDLIRYSLEEDIRDGDITTRACVSGDLRGEANIICKSDSIMCGQSIARRVFKTVDDDVRYAPSVTDGELVVSGTVVANVTGNLSSILTAERTALNYIMRLSGISTLTRRYVDVVSDTEARILDTRKTTPGLRIAEKYAVVCGGGFNHRKGLYDMILVKDNHIKAVGSLPAALKRCITYRDTVKKSLQIEVEAGSMVDVEQALGAGAEWIMLDNMDIEQIKAAVSKIRGFSKDIKVEVSGGITLENVKQYADCGVDYISVGALTHSSTSVDFSLDVVRIVQ